MIAMIYEKRMQKSHDTISFIDGKDLPAILYLPALIKQQSMY
jgi:hypothetical protein